MQPIDIFRPGSHTAMGGRRVEFSDAALADAAAYDPALHEAPIVVGHPRHDDPAYGWIAGLDYDAGSLKATPRQVDPAFAELVAAGRCKKVSAAFYGPDAAANPTPGRWYLRHVGFLGARPPALKGLEPVRFADGEAGVVVFGDFAERTMAGLFRRLREWLIAGEGMDKADAVLPAWQIDQSQEEAARPADAAFAEPETKEHDMSKDELAGREAAVKEREDAAAAKEAEFAERAKRLTDKDGAIAARETAIARADAAAFVERLAAAGRVAPGHAEGLAVFLAGLDDGDAAAGVEVGEALAMTHGLVMSLRGAFTLAGRALRSGRTGLGLGKIDLPRGRAISAKAFNLDEAGPLGRVVDFAGFVTGGSGRMLGAEDEFFKTIGCRMELHAQAFRTAAADAAAGRIPDTAAARKARAAETDLIEARRPLVLAAESGDKAAVTKLAKITERQRATSVRVGDLATAVEEATANVTVAEEAAREVAAERVKNECEALVAERTQLVDVADACLRSLVEALDALDANGRAIIARTKHSGQLTSHWRVGNVVLRSLARYLPYETPLPPDWPGWAKMEKRIVEGHLRYSALKVPVDAAA